MYFLKSIGKEKEENLTQCLTAKVNAIYTGGKIHVVLSSTSEKKGKVRTIIERQSVHDKRE
jgi:hypothetical protein